MKLTVKEAALVMGRSPRMVRYLIRQGHIQAEKVGKSWVLRSEALPLEAEARARLRGRQAEARQAVDAAFEEIGVAPHRRGAGGARRLLDLDAFRMGLALTRDLCALSPDVQPFTAPDLGVSGVRAALLEGLRGVAQGHSEFDRRAKVTAYRDARAAFSRALSDALLLGALSEGPEAQRLGRLSDGLEDEVLPALGGLHRRAEARR